MTLMRNGKQRKRNMVHRNKRRMTALACFLALALTMLTEELTDKDTVSICTYSDGERAADAGARL